MSGKALRMAIVEEIRESLRMKIEECDTRVGPEPAPVTTTGQVYVAVHPLSIRNLAPGDQQYAHLQYSVGITVSIRELRTPIDRWGSRLLDAEHGCESIHLQILRLIQANYEQILARANRLIADLEKSKELLFRPLFLIDIGNPQERMPQWWGGSAGAAAVGVSQSAVYGGAERIIGSGEPDNV